MTKHRRRSKIETDLPKELKDQVHRLLIENETYEDISLFLKQRGHDISQSSVGRYGKEFAEAYGAVKRFEEQSKALQSETGRGLAMDEALTKLLQQKVMAAIMGENFDIMDTPRLLGDIAKLQSSNVSREKFKAEIAAKAKKELADEQKQKLDKAVKTGGLDPATAQKARQILGFE